MNTLLSNVETLASAIVSLAEMAITNSEAQGWSLIQARKDHLDELAQNATAKNATDVLWIHTACLLTFGEDPKHIHDILVRAFGTAPNDRPPTKDATDMTLSQFVTAPMLWSFNLKSVHARCEELTARVLTTGSFLNPEKRATA
jgi:hypothetical protein